MSDSRLQVVVANASSELTVANASPMAVLAHDMSGEGQYAFAKRLIEKEQFAEAIAPFKYAIRKNAATYPLREFTLQQFVKLNDQDIYDYIFKFGAFKAQFEKDAQRVLEDANATGEELSALIAIYQAFLVYEEKEGLEKNRPFLALLDMLLTKANRLDYYLRTLTVAQRYFDRDETINFLSRAYPNQSKEFILLKALLLPNTSVKLDLMTRDNLKASHEFMMEYGQLWQLNLATPFIKTIKDLLTIAQGAGLGVNPDACAERIVNEFSEVFLNNLEGFRDFPSKAASFLLKNTAIATALNEEDFKLLISKAYEAVSRNDYLVREIAEILKQPHFTAERRFRGVLELASHRTCQANTLMIAYSIITKDHQKENEFAVLVNPQMSKPSTRTVAVPVIAELNDRLTEIKRNENEKLENIKAILRSFQALNPNNANYRLLLLLADYDGFSLSNKVLLMKLINKLGNHLDEDKVSALINALNNTNTLSVVENIFGASPQNFNNPRAVDSTVIKLLKSEDIIQLINNNQELWTVYLKFITDRTFNGNCLATEILMTDIIGVMNNGKIEAVKSPSNARTILSQERINILENISQAELRARHLPTPIAVDLQVQNYGAFTFPLPPELSNIPLPHSSRYGQGFFDKFWHDQDAECVRGYEEDSTGLPFGYGFLEAEDVDEAEQKVDDAAKIFGVSKNDSDAVIKEAVKTLITQSHPDRALAEAKKNPTDATDEEIIRAANERTQELLKSAKILRAYLQTRKIPQAGASTPDLAEASQSETKDEVAAEFVTNTEFKLLQSGEYPGRYFKLCNVAVEKEPEVIVMEFFPTYKKSTRQPKEKNIDFSNHIQQAIRLLEDYTRPERGIRFTFGIGRVSQKIARLATLHLGRHSDNLRFASAKALELRGKLNQLKDAENKYELFEAICSGVPTDAIKQESKSKYSSLLHRLAFIGEKVLGVEKKYIEACFKTCLIKAKKAHDVDANDDTNKKGKGPA